MKKHLVQSDSFNPRRLAAALSCSTALFLMLFVIFFGLSAATGRADSINYGNFGPVPPGVGFADVTESSGSDPVPLYGAPMEFSVGLDFDPISFTASGSAGSNDSTDGQLNFIMQGATTGPVIAFRQISVFEAGSYSLSGIGLAATTISAGAIVRVTVTEIDGVAVAPISLTPSTASFGSNLVADPGTNQIWSLGISLNIETQLVSMGTPFTAGATRVEVVIDNELIANSEALSIASIRKQDFRIEATTTDETPIPTPTPTPPPGTTHAINLSTRMRVEPGDNAGIGGFIITGNDPKHVLLRAIGPSLSNNGVPDPLADPVLELHGPDAFVTITNDNWRDTQEAEIQATGIPPTNNQESAIDATLAPGTYTAIVSGNGNTSGVALVEVYDLDQGADSKLANLSTRAFVTTGDNVVIAGVVLSNNSTDDRIVVRGLGPSLGGSGLSPVLADPTLELRDSDGTLLISNNDWQDNPDQATELTAAGLAPSDPLEAAIAATLPPGLYTAQLAGLENGTGIGLVEIYDLGPP
jgi:hypothetical protein